MIIGMNVREKNERLGGVPSWTASLSVIVRQDNDGGGRRIGIFFFANILLVRRCHKGHARSVHFIE